MFLDGLERVAHTVVALSGFGSRVVVSSWADRIGATGAVGEVCRGPIRHARAAFVVPAIRNVAYIIYQRGIQESMT